MATIDSVVVLQESGSTIYRHMGKGGVGIDGPWDSAEEAVAELTQMAGHGYEIVSHAHTDYPETTLFVRAVEGDEGESESETLSLDIVTIIGAAKRIAGTLGDYALIPAEGTALERAEEHVAWWESENGGSLSDTAFDGAEPTDADRAELRERIVQAAAEQIEWHRRRGEDSA